MRLPRPPALRAAPPEPRELRRAAAAAAAPSPPGDTRRASRLQQSLSCPARGFSLINPSRLQNRFFFIFFFSPSGTVPCHLQDFNAHAGGKVTLNSF